jgi:hypothetical protein
MKFFRVLPRAGRSRGLGLAASLIAAAAALCGAAEGAVAQVIVVQSTAPNLQGGQLLQGGAKVTIPAGKQAVFVLPSGATRTISGPFNGTTETLTKGEKANSGVFDAVKRYVVTGGTSAKNVGAMRSAMPASFAQDVPFSWQLVPLTASGDLCLLKGSRIELARPGKGGALRVTLVDTKQKRRVQTAFPENQQTVPWPDDLDLEAGRTYMLLVPNRNPRQIRIRLISQEPNRDETLQLLHRERCESQFRAWLKQMQAVAQK